MEGRLITTSGTKKHNPFESDSEMSSIGSLSPDNLESVSIPAVTMCDVAELYDKCTEDKVQNQSQCMNFEKILTNLESNCEAKSVSGQTLSVDNSHGHSAYKFKLRSSITNACDLENFDKSINEHGVFNANMELDNCQLFNLPLRNSVSGYFDWSIVPASLCDAVNGISQYVHLERELVLLSVLGCVSIATNGCFEVLFENNWREPLVDFVCVISQQSTSIEKLQNILRSVFDEFSDNYFYSKDYGVFDASTMIFDGQRNFSVASEVMHRKKHLCRPQAIVEDVKNKNFLSKLSAQGESLGLIGSEGIGLMKFLDKNPNMSDFLVKAHKMESFWGIGSGSKLTTLSRPALPSIHFMGFDTALNFFSNEKLFSKSLPQRFIPFISVGTQYQGSCATDIMSGNINMFHGKIISILKLFYAQVSNRKVYTMSLTSEALAELGVFQREMEEKLQCSYPLNYKYFLSMALGKAIRFSGDIHVWNNVYLKSENISSQETKLGIELSKLSLDHCLCLAGSGLRRYFDACRIVGHLKKIITTRGRIVYNARNIQQSIRGIDSCRTKEALKFLEENNYIRQPLLSDGRRAIVINPLLV